MPISQDEFRRLADTVATWRRPLLLTHARPDGDAVGCLVAMRAMLRRDGAEPLALIVNAAADRYAFLWEGDPITGTAEAIDPPARADAFAPDGVLVLDTCSYAQLEPMSHWLRSGPGRGLPKIALDHHITRDPVADEYLIDESASASALIVLDWATAAGWPIERRSADALMVGLATDTGWFRYSNTDARTLTAAARLAECGAVAAALYDKIYNCEKPERVRLEAAAVSTLELPGDGRIAVMSLQPHHFHAAGATESDTSDIVNIPMRIDGVRVSLLLVVDTAGVVRVSLRSMPPSDVVPDINIAEVAAAFGGGGHSRAAGARVQGSLEAVKKRVLAKLCAAGA
ncbi:MAG: bifunctional oligoribonuclease/PAP phosphatase NrnA [Phycisphaerales bacterium]|nr:MAG: bifunctional oligoribonuclease/PAP phosphatase NrnA [Phycisphaerales bacterium]